jgi:hypothetical protein
MAGQYHGRRLIAQNGLARGLFLSVVLPRHPWELFFCEVAGLKGKNESLGIFTPQSESAIFLPSYLFAIPLVDRLRQKSRVGIIRGFRHTAADGGSRFRASRGTGR